MLRNDESNHVNVSLESLIDNYNADELKIADFNNDGIIDNPSMESSVYAYNMAIDLLNKACEDDVPENGNIIEVRCAGSDLINKNSETTTRYISEEIKQWPINNDTYPAGICNGKLKDTDFNYVSDYERMLLLGIINPNYSGYWLASRVVRPFGEDEMRFYVRVVGRNYDWDVDGVYEVNVEESRLGSLGSGNAAGLRPVVKLKPDVVFSGLGTDADPYTF